MERYGKISRFCLILIAFVARSVVTTDENCPHVRERALSINGTGPVNKSKSKYFGYIAELGSTVVIECNSSLIDPVSFHQFEKSQFVKLSQQTRSGRITKVMLANLSYDNAGSYGCEDICNRRDSRPLVVTDPEKKTINWTCSTYDLKLISCRAEFLMEAMNFQYTGWELSINSGDIQYEGWPENFTRYPEFKFNKSYRINQYQLKLTAHTVVKTEIYLHNVTVDHHITILSEPELSVDSQESSKLLIRISYNRSVGLLAEYIRDYSVRCSVQVETNNVAFEQEERFNTTSIHSVVISDLTPYTKYQISVKCRLDLEASLYSKTSTINLTTEQGVPEKAPTAENDSYFIDDDYCRNKEGKFGVRLYWKELSSQTGFGNGPILHYEVQLNNTILDKVNGSKFSAHVCIQRVNVTQRIYVYPVNKIGRGKRAAEFTIMQDLPSNDPCMIKGEIIPGDNLTRSSELRISIITHQNQTQNFKVHSCVAVRDKCQREYAVVENPRVFHSIKNMESQYIRLDTLTVPYVENIRYGVSNTAGGITWINCINAQKSTISDLNLHTQVIGSKIELKWQTSCLEVPSDYLIISVNYCLCEYDRCVDKEHSRLWETSCNSTFLISDLQYGSDYKVWFTTLNSTSLLDEPLILSTEKREIETYEIVLIILSTVIFCVLLILLVICIRRQRKLWKRFKKPVVVKITDLHSPDSDPINALSEDDRSDPYFKITRVNDYQTVGWSSGNPTKNNVDWDSSQVDGSRMERSNAYQPDKTDEIQYLELEPDSYQPNNTIPPTNRITPVNSGDAVSLISEDLCSLNSSSGITMSQMCKYFTEQPPSRQLNYQELNSSDAL